MTSHSGTSNMNKKKKRHGMACVSKWEVKGHEEEENILRVKIKDKDREEKMSNLLCHSCKNQIQSRVHPY